MTEQEPSTLTVAPGPRYTLVWTAVLLGVGFCFIDVLATQQQNRLRHGIIEAAHVMRISTMGEMASTMAHELNQPLTALLTYCGTALKLAREIPSLIDPAVAGSLFEPYQTSKEAGMGMGLSISRSILEAHNGTLRVDEQRQQGALFCMQLPGSD